MLRDENLLFALYAYRIGMVTKEQFVAITKTLKPGVEADLGKSLVKRHVIDETQSKSLWDLIGVQQAMLGDARQAMGHVPMDEDIRAALHAAIIAGDLQPSKAATDKGTIEIDPPAAS